MDATHVDLGGYRITIARGALAALGETARAAAPAHRYAIVTDENVGPRYADAARRALGGDVRVHTIPAGELHKTRETWASLTDALLADGIGRDGALVALGGGVVGDLAGFVAATFMRGIPYVQVPTTLLAMIDASIGGKTGVDTPAGKNLVGAFHPPAAVVADPDVLRTLPREHLRAGLAEAIKHGVIADAAYFDEVVGAGLSLLDGGATAATRRALDRLVERSVGIKADVVRRDEREGGVRKTLNFGHTLGHAIEHGSAFAMLHGDAVAIGMVLESRIAESLGIAERGTAARVREGVERVSLPVDLPIGQRAADILGATRTDKKARGGRVEYALPARVGAMAAADGGYGVPVDDDAVLGVLRDAERRS